MPDSKPPTPPNDRRHFLKGSAATSTLVAGAAGAAALSAMQTASAAGMLDPAIYGANYLITEGPWISGSTGPQLLRKVTIPKAVLVGKTIIRVHGTVSFPNSTNGKTFCVEHGLPGFSFGSNPKIIALGGMSTSNGVVARGEVSMNAPSSQATYGFNSYAGGYGLTNWFSSTAFDYVNNDMEIVFWGQMSSAAERMTLINGLVEVIKG
jgi:hypothetical protein